MVIEVCICSTVRLYMFYTTRVCMHTYNVQLKEGSRVHVLKKFRKVIQLYILRFYKLQHSLHNTNYIPF